MQNIKQINIFKSFLVITFQILFILFCLGLIVKFLHNFATANSEDYLSYLTFMTIFTILATTGAIMFLTVITVNFRRSINGLDNSVDFLAEFMTEKEVGSRAYSYNRSLDSALNEALAGVCYAAGLKKIPELYILNSFIPTAFSYGSSIDNCKIFVTSGLIKILNDDEMIAVLANQIGQIVNYDVVYFYHLTPFVRIYMNIIRGLFRDIFVERVRENNFLSDYLLCAFILRKPSSIHPIWLIVSVVSLIIPFIMSLFYMLLPQKRIYYADAFAVKITRNPNALLSALKKIHKIISLPEDAAAEFYNKISNGNNSDFATMFLNDDTLLSKDPLLNSCFIVPVMRKFEGKGIFCTHPDIEKRIKILSLMENPAHSAYSSAYRKVTGCKDSF